MHQRSAQSDLLVPEEHDGRHVEPDADDRQRGDCERPHGVREDLNRGVAVGVQFNLIRRRTLGMFSFYLS